MSARPRRDPCLNADGSLKRRYGSRKAAKAYCQKGQVAYPCDLHGERVWHVGRNRYRPKNPHEQVTPGGVS